jgi:uncharacterized protein YjbI with pentapeptide repeats
LRQLRSERIDLARLSCEDAQGRPHVPVDLTHVDLSNVDLTGARLSGASLEDANLTKALLTRATIADTDFAGADLTDTDLTGAPVGFKQEQLSEAKWSPGHPPHVDNDKEPWVTR